MNTWSEKRIAVSALIDAGKSTNVIVADLGVSRSLVLKVKQRLAAGKDLQAWPRKAKRPILTPRVVGGLKKESRRRRQRALEG